MSRIIDSELSSITSSVNLPKSIVKEVPEKTGMFYEEGEMSWEDVRTRVAAQRLDLKLFTKLGDYLPDLDGWHDME